MTVQAFTHLSAYSNTLSALALSLLSLSRRRRNSKSRGLDDAERCWEIGLQVLRKLEQLDKAGAERPQVQVFGEPGQEQVAGMSQTA